MAVAVLLAVRLGLVDVLRDRDRLESFLTDSGPVGPLAYVLAFTAAQPISLPGAVLIVPATFVWSGWTVFLLSWLGGMIASTIGFVIARWIARDWVQDRLPERLLSWNDRIGDHGTRAIIWLRIVTGYAPAADWLLGVSTVTMHQFLLGTGIGLVPTTALWAFLGDDAVRLAGRLPWVAAGVGALALLVGFVRSRRRTARQASAAVGGPPA